MSVVKTVQDLRKKLAAASASFQDEIASMRRQITDLRARLEHAKNAPLPVEEIRERVIPQTVAEMGAWWCAEWGDALVRGERALGSPKIAGSRTLPWGTRDPMPFAALCAADPAFAARLLSGLVGAVSYVPGPSSAARPAIVAKLETDLRELESSEEDVVDDASAAGVIIQHRPEVIQHREADAAAKKREAEAVAARQQREEELNRAHATARAATSPYLDRERAR